MAIDPEMRERARFLYKQGFSVARISEETEISEHTIMYWIDKGTKTEAPWKQIKLLERANELKDHLERNRITTKEIFDMGMEVLWRSMREMLTGNVNLTEKGMNTMMNMLDKLEKWRQGEEAKHPPAGMSESESAEILDIKNLFNTEEKAE